MLKLIKWNLILLITIPLFILNCAYVTIGRSDSLYAKELKRDQTDNKLIKMSIKIAHSLFTDEYFAHDSVSDSMYSVYPKFRKEYDKKIGYFNLGGKTACGWRSIKKLELLDSSHFSVVEINLEEIKWGICKLKILAKDTGNIPMRIYFSNDFFQSDLKVSKDTVLFEDRYKIKFERKKWPLPFLWVVHLWPFWPSFN